jgi:hypothetical protein
MKPYLTWLEAKEKAAAPITSAHPAPVPITSTAPTAVPVPAGTGAAPVAVAVPAAPAPVAKQAPAAFPVAAPIPAGKPASGVMPAAPPLPPGKPASGTLPTAGVVLPVRGKKPDQAEHRPKRKKGPPPIPGAPSPPEGEAIFDVELVPVPGSPGKAKAGRLPITRRDLLAFGLGVGSTLLAILVGWLLALLFRKRKSEGD